MRTELRFGAWLEYEANYLSDEEAKQLFEALKAEQDWEIRTIYALGKAVQQPRLMRWNGILDYRYSSQTLEARPFPNYILPLLQKISNRCDTPFNHIVINYYRNGEDHIGVHADNEPELGRNPVIAAISLGVTRDFALIPKTKKGRHKHKFKIPLEHASLLVMGGRMQHTWRHAIPKSKTSEERFNITFRHIKAEPGQMTREMFHGEQRIS